MRNQQVGTRAQTNPMLNERERGAGARAQNNGRNIAHEPVGTRVQNHGRNFAHEPVGTRANARIGQVAAQARHEVYVEPTGLRSPYKGRTFHLNPGYRESFCQAIARFFKIIFCCAC